MKRTPKRNKKAKHITEAEIGTATPNIKDPETGIGGKETVAI